MFCVFNMDKHIILLTPSMLTVTLSQKLAQLQYLLYTEPSDHPAGFDSEPELKTLMNEVAAKIPGKWRDVGLQLGVDQSILDGIATISQGDTNLSYSNVFTRWKNQNSTTHPYTWSTIVQALKAPAVGEERLADKISAMLGHHH